MVIGVCSISSDKEEYFRSIGVKDSKLLSPTKRNELYKIIKEQCCEYSLAVITAQELNVLMGSISLNEIETQKFANLINGLEKKSSSIIIDSPEQNTVKYKEKLCRYVPDEYNKSKIICENKADLNYIVVGCASILAKVTRDNLLEQLIGFKLSGYPADPKTIKYLKEYFLENGQFPDFTRTKWKTIDNIINELHQSKLGWFK
jgi:ribonuclease HII